MKRYGQKICLLIGIMVLVSGCLYPQDSSNSIELLTNHVEDVQQAVDRYLQNESVLPIKTREADTAIYQKYVVDFAKLVPAYMTEPPSTAFENGGNYMYVLIDVEENPAVKLYDLRVPDQLHNVQQQINLFTVEEERYPRGIEIAPGVFELNEALIKDADMKIPSPYVSQSMLPLVMASDGTVYVDYRADLEHIIEQLDALPPTEQDLRTLLTDESIFVPAQSLPYRYEDGDIIFDVEI